MGVLCRHDFPSLGSWHTREKRQICVRTACPEVLCQASTLIQMGCKQAVDNQDHRLKLCRAPMASIKRSWLW